MSAKRSIARTLLVLSILVLLSLQPERVAAQVIIPPQPANLVLVTVFSEPITGLSDAARGENDAHPLPAQDCRRATSSS